MLLSDREMGLGDDHAGIVDLPEDAPVGVPYAEWAGLDDPVIDVSVTPNRGDCFSVRGIARDLAAAGIGTLKPWQPREDRARVLAAARAGRSTWPEACPWILGRTIRNVRNGPSPQWLQDRLISIGLRPINVLGAGLCQPIASLDHRRSGPDRPRSLPSPVRGQARRHGGLARCGLDLGMSP